MSKRADCRNGSNATELCKSSSSIRFHSKCGKKALGHFPQRMGVDLICIMKSLLWMLRVGGRRGGHGSREVVEVQSGGKHWQLSWGHWQYRCEKEQHLHCTLKVDA